jgi:hypothetical protein
MEKILESLINVAPIINEMFDGKAAITICDRNKCLYALDGKAVKASLNTGQELDNASLERVGLIDSIYRKKKTISSVLNKREHGVDLKATAFPALNEKGEVVGYISLNTNVQEYVRMAEAGDNLKTSLQETNLTMMEITKSAVQLSEKLNYMVQNTEKTEKLIQESTEAVTLIESIAKQSNLLGLNAAIESSRAGEYGKGFSVVAGEMRKLALNSGESSKKISSALEDMSNSMKVIIETISELGQISTNQAASLEEASATVEQLSLNSEVLVEHIKSK